jgi:hypothetical protein
LLVDATFLIDITRGARVVKMSIRRLKEIEGGATESYWLLLV